jgi:hypothetical protein
MTSYEACEFHGAAANDCDLSSSASSDDDPNSSSMGLISIDMVK